MDDEITCPYCDKEYALDHDDGRFYSEDKAEEDQCPNCEKTILVSTSISYYHDAEKADCLNGSPHPFSEWSTYWIGEKGENEGKFYERRYCTTCGKDEWEYHEKRLDTRPSERFDGVENVTRA